MAEVEIAIGKSKYKISCQESEKEKLIKTADKLNERVNKLSLSFRNIDEKTLLVISALTIEEELQNSTKKNHCQNAENSTEQLSDRDIYDAVSENMENISDYVTKLTKKIREYTQSDSKH